ncbi:MAG TPA: AMP-binding protein, partial [Aldersonia sp.]
MTGLDTPLTPLRFLARAAAVHPDKQAVLDGERSLTYAEFAAGVTRLAHALRASGVSPGDRVAYIATNSAELLAAHYAVPLAGGVLVAINTRLAAEEVDYICGHSGSVLLFGDAEFLTPLAGTKLETVRGRVELPAQDGTYTAVDGATRLDALLERGADDPIPWEVDDETATITVNYTSGTTGKPKGVMYTHRGAYLNSLGEVYHQGFGLGTRYLWSLPMFH